jgi:hypothetical protein
MSRDIAEAINAVTAPDDRLLLTTFSYEKGRHCPVFHYYVKPRDVVIRPWQTPYNELVALIKRYELDWAILSPGRYPETQEVTKQFADILSQRPLVLDGAVIFHVASLRDTAPTDPSAASGPPPPSPASFSEMVHE